MTNWNIKENNKKTSGNHSISVKNFFFVISSYLNLIVNLEVKKTIEREIRLQKERKKLKFLLIEHPTTAQLPVISLVSKLPSNPSKIFWTSCK